MCPDRGWNLQPFWYMGQCSSPLSHPGRGAPSFCIFIDFRERKWGGRDRNIDVREKH